METTTAAADEKGIGEVDIAGAIWRMLEKRATGECEFRSDHSIAVLFENYT